MDSLSPDGLQGEAASTGGGGGAGRFSSTVPPEARHAVGRGPRAAPERASSGNPHGPANQSGGGGQRPPPEQSPASRPEQALENLSLLHLQALAYGQASRKAPLEQRLVTLNALVAGVRAARGDPVDAREAARGEGEGKAARGKGEGKAARGEGHREGAPHAKKDGRARSQERDGDARSAASEREWGEAGGWRAELASGRLHAAPHVRGLGVLEQAMRPVLVVIHNAHYLGPDFAKSVPCAIYGRPLPCTWSEEITNETTWEADALWCVAL